MCLVDIYFGQLKIKEAIFHSIDPLDKMIELQLLQMSKLTIK